MIITDFNQPVIADKGGKPGGTKVITLMIVLSMGGCLLLREL